MNIDLFAHGVVTSSWAPPSNSMERGSWIDVQWWSMLIQWSLTCLTTSITKNLWNLKTLPHNFWHLLVSKTNSTWLLWHTHSPWRMHPLRCESLPQHFVVTNRQSQWDPKRKIDQTFPILSSWTFHPAKLRGVQHLRRPDALDATSCNSWYVHIIPLENITQFEKISFVLIRHIMLNPWASLITILVFSSEGFQWANHTRDPSRRKCCKWRSFYQHCLHLPSVAASPIFEEIRNCSAGLLHMRKGSETS